MNFGCSMRLCFGMEDSGCVAVEKYYEMSYHAKLLPLSQPRNLPCTNCKRLKLQLATLARVFLGVVTKDMGLNSTYINLCNLFTNKRKKNTNSKHPH